MDERRPKLKAPLWLFVAEFDSPAPSSAFTVPSRTKGPRRAEAAMASAGGGGERAGRPLSSTPPTGMSNWIGT